MLVENKFLFISLPRGASTAFKESCILHRYDIKHSNSKFDFIYQNDKVYQNKIDLSFFLGDNDTIDNNKITEEKCEIDTDGFGKKSIIYHPHERLIHLLNRFGHKYPIIAIKRNIYHRFISIFSKVLELLYQSKDYKSYEILSKINHRQLFCFEPTLIIEEKYETIAQIVFDKLELNKDKIQYIMRLLELLFKPMSHWHNNSNKIIWFNLEDTKSMNDLENWVSDITKKKFILHKSNEIKEPIVYSLKVDNDFRWLHDTYYKQTENQKIIKTLL